MKRIIITPLFLLIGFGIIVIALLVQATILSAVKGSTTVFQGSCAVESWSEGNNSRIRLNLNCGDGRKAKTEDRYFILEYLNNPGSLQCSVDALDYANCTILK